MNPYIFKSACEVCGGEGMARPGEAWGPNRHVDPRVCAQVLERKRRDLEAREKALAEKEAA